MAGFNRFGSGGFGSLYAGMGSLQQPSAVNRRDDRFDDRRNPRDFDRRERDFGRRDPSPRRRRYSPDPPYSGLRGSRQDDRGSLGSYAMDDLGRDSFARNRGGQSSSDRDLMRDGRNLRPPSRGGDGILGAKPGDMPRDLTPNPSSGNFTSQIAQQQQQLMAMVQTQSLLAALQASATGKQGGRQPPSLLQGIRMHDNRGRMNDRNNRKRRMSPPRGGQRGNMNQLNHRQRRSQQYRNTPGNRSSYQQRRDHDRDRKRVSESSQKSEDEPIEEPYVEEKIDDEDEEEKEEAKEEKTTKAQDKEPAKKSEAVTSVKTTKSEEAKPESNENEDGEFESETNLAGQNINNLVKSLYDNSRRKYVCKVCKIMCTKESCFRQHLYGRRHVKTWLESRGQSFEAEMFRRASEEAAKSLAKREQAKKPKENGQEKTEQLTEEKQEAKEQAETVRDKKEGESSVPAGSSAEETTAKVKEEPAEVKKEKSPPPEPAKVKEEKFPVKEEKFEAKYSCDNKKVAIKEAEYITISSITEARVRLKGFDKGANTQGCEFVKAVSGFNCRLCKTFILHGGDVMKHVEGRKHQNKYRRYINEHPKYESNQLVRNKELSEMLSEREGEVVLLYEVIENEEPKRPYRHGSEEVMDVEVTRYVAAEDEPDEPDDSLLEQDESHEDLLREDPMETSASSEKKDIEGDILNDEDGDGKDLEQVEIDGDGTLEEKYDPDLGKTLDEPVAEQTESETTETKDDPNTSVDSSSESQEEAQEEPLEKKAKVTPTAGRRGRRAARGGAQASGRGRGRGGKRATRQKATPKQEVLPDEKHGDDFMDGYEVIDEVADDE